MTGNLSKLHTFSSNESYECVELEMREPAPPRSKRSRKWILGITIAAIFMLGAGIGTIVVAFSKSKQSPSAVEPGLSSVSVDNDDESEISNDPGPLSKEPTRSPTSSLFSSQPTIYPSYLPTAYPSFLPTSIPTARPSFLPTSTPTAYPSSHPTPVPTTGPSSDPTFNPSIQPSSSPTERPVTYEAGYLTKQEGNLLLSTGLTSRIIARFNETVEYANAQRSTLPFHIYADFGATFIDDRPENPGGMIYVSNSEDRDLYEGGVGAITFDKDYNVIDYRMVLTNTTANCGGGRTPWGSWISCEETRWGQVWQVDPTGQHAPGVITLGSDYGHFESFAYDIRNLDDAHFFITEDAPRGPIQRFTPHDPNWQDPWNILYGPGDVHYLLLYPDDNQTYYTGRYEWTTNKNAARDNTQLYYPHCEGIDVAGNQMFFVSKRTRTMFTLDLDGDTYTNKTTRHGLFDGAPDQIARVIGSQELLYFTEEGGRDPGVHARNALGQFFTIFESPVYNDETTGLAFSPDGTRMYVAYQETGVLYEIRREDGYPFHEKNLNVKYHNLGFSRR